MCFNFVKLICYLLVGPFVLVWKGLEAVPRCITACCNGIFKCLAACCDGIAKCLAACCDAIGKCLHALFHPVYLAARFVGQKLCQCVRTVCRSVGSPPHRTTRAAPSLSHAEPRARSYSHAITPPSTS